MSSGVRLQGGGWYEVDSYASMRIPSGTDAQRPASPTQGDMRFNTTSNVLEIFDGGTWTVPTGGGGVTVSTINSITTTNPVQINTTAPHNLIDGNTVNISGVTGTVELNGNNYYVDVISPDTFDLYTDYGLTSSVAGAGFTPYVSGGVVVPGSTTPSLLQLTDTPSTYSGAGKYLKINPSNDGVEFDSLTTDDIIEGSSNKFFNGKTTDDLPEGYASLYLSATNLGTFSIDTLLDVKTTGAGHVPTDGQALVYDASMGHWMPGTVSGGGSGTPGGSSTQVQYNQAGAFAGDADFTYDSTTDTLSVQNLNLTGNFTNTASGTPTVLSSNDLVLQSDTTTGEIRLRGSNVELVDSPLQFKTYTAAGLSALSSPTAGQVSYVTDGLLGAPGIAVYTGSSWEYIKPGVTGGSSISSMVDAFQTNPVVVTTGSAHGLNNGQKLTITDVVGMVELNGNSYYANVLSSTIFELYTDAGLTTPVDGTLYNLYISGGEVAGQFEVISPSGIQNVVEDVTPQLGGNLDVNGNEITAASGNVMLSPAPGGYLHLGSGTTATHTVGMYDKYFFPNASPTAGQVLVAGSFPHELEWGAGGGGGTAYDQSLNTTDNVQFVSVTTDSIVTSTSGTPTINSSSNIILAATGSVVIYGGFRLPNMNTLDRDALAATNGEMVYNTDDNRIQAYQNGAWINIDDGSAA